MLQDDATSSCWGPWWGSCLICTSETDTGLSGANCPRINLLQGLLLPEAFKYFNWSCLFCCGQTTICKSTCKHMTLLLQVCNNCLCIFLTFPLCQMNMDPEKDQLPFYFNSAEKWPGKIHEPLDQGNCAASWAFSTAGRGGITWETWRKIINGILLYDIKESQKSEEKH